MRWDEAWPADAALYGDDSWAHHDLAVAADGRLVGFRSGTGSCWILDREGRLAGEWASGLGEGYLADEKRIRVQSRGPDPDLAAR